METVRIELEGDYAVVFKEMKHKTTRALQQLIRESIPAEKFAEIQGESDLEKRKTLLMKVQVDGDDIVTLMNQVESWSFGEVTPSVIDEMPERKYQLLVAEVNKLYSQTPLT
jgi:hypothetical protein